jgi:hypothetical protein
VTVHELNYHSQPVAKEHEQPELLQLASLILQSVAKVLAVAYQSPKHGKYNDEQNNQNKKFHP